MEKSTGSVFWGGNQFSFEIFSGHPSRGVLGFGSGSGLDIMSWVPSIEMIEITKEVSIRKKRRKLVFSYSFFFILYIYSIVRLCHFFFTSRNFQTSEKKVEKMVQFPTKHLCMYVYFKENFRHYISAPININTLVYISTREGLLKIEPHIKTIFNRQIHDNF